MCVCVCVEMVDRGEFDKMIKISGKMDKSFTYKSLVVVIFRSLFQEFLQKCLIYPSLLFCYIYIYILNNIYIYIIQHIFHFSWINKICNDLIGLSCIFSILFYNIFFQILSTIYVYINILIQISLNIIDIFCLHIFLLIRSYCHIAFIIFGGNWLMYFP